MLYQNKNIIPDKNSYIERNYVFYYNIIFRCLFVLLFMTLYHQIPIIGNNGTLSLIPNNPSNITSREKYTFYSIILLFYIYITNPDIGYITRYRLQYLYITIQIHYNQIPINGNHGTISLIPNNHSNVTSREKYTFYYLIILSVILPFSSYFSLIYFSNISNIFSYITYFSNN